jgi:mono/diheme cytochrome c family protein
MQRRAWITTATLSLLAVGIDTTRVAHADDPQPRLRAGGSDLVVHDRPVGSVRPPSTGPHVGSHGSTVVVDAHGVLVAERNAGALIRSDREGKPVASLPLHPGLGELVHDGAGLMFVADRTADRVVRVSAGDAAGQGLAVAGAVEITEPHGLALTPDGKTLLVTSVADHALVAVDSESLAIRWRVELAAEPRGVAVSSDGRRAVVGFLSSGALAVVDLATAGERVRWQSLDPRDPLAIDGGDDDEFAVPTAQIREARSRFQVPANIGRRRARNVFAVAFVGNDLAVAPHQLTTPQMQLRPSEGMEDSYGGGAESIPPLVHRLATLADAGTATMRVGLQELTVHQPRALAYDLGGDVLYLGGYGDDRVVAVHDASQQAPYVRWHALVGKGQACGVDGLAVDGDALWIHCELSRRLVRLDTNAVRMEGGDIVADAGTFTVGPELAASQRSPLAERGAELFRRANDSRLSDGGVLACASCHPEGRSDGLTWRLGNIVLQTPMLAGRVVGTGPYKWDGQDEDLRASIHHTIGRLGGSPESLSRKEVEGLFAYITEMSSPRPPAVVDAEAVVRGKELFASKALACDACHAGDKLTDGAQYPLEGRLGTNDTPSLVGLAHTAPYYHDGSAGTLRTLLTDRGNVHDMAELGALTEDQIGDLSAYLRTL